MCSFDVRSLFTDVPLHQTMEICLNKLYALANPTNTALLRPTNWAIVASHEYVITDNLTIMHRDALESWKLLGYKKSNQETKLSF